MDSFVGSLSPISLVIADRASSASAERVRICTATMSAIVFREILKPLAAGLGPVGETALERGADDIFLKRPT